MEYNYTITCISQKPSLISKISFCIYFLLSLILRQEGILPKMKNTT